jgi:hypothetical protein
VSGWSLGKILTRGAELNLHVRHYLDSSLSCLDFASRLSLVAIQRMLKIVGGFPALGA